jgi:CRISPR-associated protein Csd1
MLQELCYLATRENLIGDTAFEVRPIAWIINLKTNGDFLNFSGTHEAEAAPEPKKGTKHKKPKEIAKKFTIPRQFNPDTGGTRTSGDYAYFLVDKSDYVLGCALETKAAQPPTNSKLVNRHKLFISKVRDCYEATKEERMKAVLIFLERIHMQGLPVDLPEKTAPGDLYGFVVRPDVDEFVHDLPAIQQYWREFCGGSGGGADQDWQCLITGKPMGTPSLFPMVKRVPGGQAQTGIVSFNSTAFESYGWASNANAPVSSDAAQAAGIAMNRLLDTAFQTQDGKVLQKRHIRISEDTVVCFWAKEASGDEVADGLPAALQADPSGKAGPLWQAVWRGKLPPKLDASKFYSVTLTGAQGRAIVRDWYETTVGEVQASLAEYFRQLELQPNTRPGKDKELPPQYGLRTLQECLVTSRKADDLPSKYAAELFAASINQRIRFPSSLLTIALDRMRAEAGRDDWIDSYRRDARAGLIKAILIRNHDQHQLTPTMNEKNKQPGYLLGRLFACIERMQYLALDQVNANIATRYFAAASTTPRLIFNSLMKDLQGHYFKKAQRKKAGAAWMVQRHVCEIETLYGEVMDPKQGYPARFSPVDQGLFMIGYHTQRGLYLPRKDKATTLGISEETTNDTDEAADESAG